MSLLCLPTELLSVILMACCTIDLVATSQVCKTLRFLCTHLVGVHLDCQQEFNHIPPSGLKTICEIFVHITDVSFGAAFGDAHFKVILLHCPNLKHFKGNPTDDQLEIMASHQGVDAITLHDGGPSINKFSDVGLACFLGHPHVMRCIRLLHTTLTSVTAQSIVAHCTQLTELTLVSCYSLFDNDVVSIVNRNPKLNLITLKGCGNLTDATVLSIAGSCPNLVGLDISECWRITEVAIAALNRCSKLLLTIKCADCFHLLSFLSTTLTLTHD